MAKQRVLRDSLQTTLSLGREETQGICQLATSEGLSRVAEGNLFQRRLWDRVTTRTERQELLQLSRSSLRTKSVSIRLTDARDAVAQA